MDYARCSNLAKRPTTLHTLQGLPLETIETRTSSIPSNRVQPGATSYSRANFFANTLQLAKILGSAGFCLSCPVGETVAFGI